MTNNSVTILRVAKKGKKYLVTTTVDDELVFTEDQLVNYRIVKGAVFETAAWEKVKATKDHAFLFDKALHYLDYKLRTTKETIAFLEAKEAPPELIDEIIERLHQIKYLDDDRYATQFVDEGMRNYKGPKALSYALEQKGVSSKIINEKMLVYTRDKEVELATIVANKYQKLNLRYPAKKQKEMIYQKLIRDGYNFDTINSVIARLTYEDDSLENLQKEYERLLSKTDDRNKIITQLMAKGYKYEDIKKIVKNQR